MSELNKLSITEFLAFIVNAFIDREDLGLLIAIVVPKKQSEAVRFITEDARLFDILSAPEVLRMCAARLEQQEATSGKIPIEFAKRPM